MLPFPHKDSCKDQEIISGWKGQEQTFSYLPVEGQTSTDSLTFWFLVYADKQNLLSVFLNVCSNWNISNIL